MGLNGFCLMGIPCLFDREQCFRGREEINLLVHTCHSMLSILYPFYFFFFVFSYFCCDTLLEVAITVFCDCDPFLLCMAKPLFIVPAVTEFYYFSFEQPLSGLGVLADHLLVCQPPPLTYAGRDTRQRRLFCLFTCRAIV